MKLLFISNFFICIFITFVKEITIHGLKTYEKYNSRSHFWVKTMAKILCVIFSTFNGYVLYIFVEKLSLYEAISYSIGITLIIYCYLYKDLIKLIKDKFKKGKVQLNEVDNLFH
jgi:hypothetical protein